MGKHDIDRAELSRREWLLKLGEAAVLLGFSGSAELAATGNASPQATAQAISELPPGLYLPSSDHLAHALASDSLLHTVPAGSETDYVRARSGPYKPQFFSPREFAVARRIVALMLGEADERVAAGAGDDHENVVAVVAEWIDLRAASAPGIRDAARRLTSADRALAVAYYGSEFPVRELENSAPDQVAREGLAWLAEESTRRFGQPFLELKEEQQTTLLRDISEARPPRASEHAGTRFFDLMKREVIRGFYTSRAGLKELDYKKNAFYAESPGCPGHEHSAGARNGSGASESE